MNIDWNFVSIQEGGQKLEGYVLEKRDKSGVTIATGYDLGQHNDGDLQRYGVSRELRDKVSDYLGRRGIAARTILAEKPLTVTVLEADELDRAAKLEIAGGVRRRYDKHVIGKNGILRFDELPMEVQTVIASVAFQHGSDLPSKTPNFWKAVILNDWWAAYDVLMGATEYPSRRQEEARYLRKWLERRPRMGR
jgi:hypothetical protein